MEHVFCRSAHSTTEAQATQGLGEEKLDLPEEKHKDIYVSKAEDNKFAGKHNFWRRHNFPSEIVGNEDWAGWFGLGVRVDVRCLHVCFNTCSVFFLVVCHSLFLAKEIHFCRSSSGAGGHGGSVCTAWTTCNLFCGYYWPANPRDQVVQGIE